MPKVVVTGQVEDLVKWEEGFRTHGDLFRSQTVSGPIGIATNEDNEVAVCFDASDLDRFLKGFYPARADTSEKAHLGPGGVSWQSEGSTARSLNVRRSG